MSITLDAPPSAVAIWQEGTKWCLRLPDAQLIEIPAGAVQRLAQILQSREAKAINYKLNTMALPTQEIIDRWRDADDPGFKEETWEERIERAGARRRAQDERRKAREEAKKIKIAAERRRLKEAEQLLAELDL